ncbi:hypothetical protein C8035_v009375 [Colletotrichum spinosum]|uniref:Rhodopsin domain-containing protein n=1 Tax=Colletotrichum spinosum TaxID=1347390 RepID=A0A4R8Q777_9PEZI|nr:hypothetical protein C8035_v009375 [Colletotrichum spinosum]
MASINVYWLMKVFLIPGDTLKITLARVHHNLQSVALGLTKTSFGLTLLRLMPGGWEAKLVWAVIITMNLQFAIHIVATWQAICGSKDAGHIGGSNCWGLNQSVTFSIFSALYSAVCDFILGLLPWKMIFNLQMKQSERIGIAVALSMGVLAGVTGIMKAAQGYKLMDVRSPDNMYNQAVYWVWSMAEPNVTVISASIPVLRGFVRNVRKRTESSPGAGAYVKTGDHGSKFCNRSTVTAAKSRSEDEDGGSECSILDQAQTQHADGLSGRGIALTTEIRVEHESGQVISTNTNNGNSGVAGFELQSFSSPYESALQDPNLDKNSGWTGDLAQNPLKGLMPFEQASDEERAAYADLINSHDLTVPSDITENRPYSALLDMRHRCCLMAMLLGAKDLVDDDDDDDDDDDKAITGAEESREPVDLIDAVIRRLEQDLSFLRQVQSTSLRGHC